MWAIGFLVLFFGLLAAGMPIFLVLGACASVLYFVSGQPIIGLAQNMIDQLNSTTLMSLPLFVMAAAFMRRGGVAQALVDLASAWLGGIKGSLGLVAVVSCALFAAISGSSVATALAMGTILLPAMIERGYPRAFALGVLGASGTIGVVIPPSLALILYGIVTEQSVPRLFLAGIVPGLVQAAAFFVWVLWYARRKNFPSEPPMALGDAAARHVCAALPAMAVPLVVLVRHLWRLHDGDGIGRDGGGDIADRQPVRLSRLPLDADAGGDRRGAVVSAAVIMLIIATALVFGHWMTGSGIPAQAGEVRRRPGPEHLGIPAGDEHHAADHRLLPGGGQHAAAGDADPGPGADAAGMSIRCISASSSRTTWKWGWCIRRSG